MNTILLISTIFFLLTTVILAFKRKSTPPSPDFNQVVSDCQKYFEKMEETVKKNNEETSRQYKEMNQKIERSFEAAANKSLVQNLEKLQSVSSKGIELSLAPIVKGLKTYEEKMEAMIKSETSERSSFKEVLKAVSEMNRGFSEQAANFSASLRGNIHALGKFGEDSLQNILESSGYTEGKDYLCQKTCSTITASGRPDFLILAPGKRAVVVDSKLPLDAFMNYMEEANESKKKKYVQDLLRNINTHVTELSKKEYTSITEYEILGFVLLFVSSDSAITLALSEDKNLLRTAINKNILIVGPTTLMATLKTITFLWREEQQKENYKEIAATGKSLYEKFKLFTDRMKEVQKNFTKAHESLDVAFNHLNRGDSSLVAEAQTLKELGINSEKEVA